MFTLTNGCGVLGDVSYAAPDSQGYAMPTYWRFTVWGTRGVLEFSYGDPRVRAYLDGEKSETILDAPVESGSDYLDTLLLDIQGKPAELNTAAVLAASRATLDIQAAADQAECA